MSIIDVINVILHWEILPKTAGSIIDAILHCAALLDSRGDNRRYFFVWDLFLCQDERIPEHVDYTMDLLFSINEIQRLMARNEVRERGV
jgi:hypothetical protein